MVKSKAKAKLERNFDIVKAFLTKDVARDISEDFGLSPNHLREIAKRELAKLADYHHGYARRLAALQERLAESELHAEWVISECARLSKENRDLQKIKGISALNDLKARCIQAERRAHRLEAHSTELQRTNTELSAHIKQLETGRPDTTKNRLAGEYDLIRENLGRFRPK